MVELARPSDRMLQKWTGKTVRPIVRWLYPFVLGCVLAVCWPACGLAGSPGGPSYEQRTQWFRQAKFGMFIHWGIYSVPAGEWKGSKNHAEWIMLTGNIPSAEYEKFAKQFNPVKFDARAWVQLAKEAGMRYIVITAKHHDGFCMYDSKLTDYDIVDATPFGRDPMKELAEACRQAGLKFCFYYSVVDWHHPEFPAHYSQRGFHGDPNPNADLNKYVAYMKGQVRELLTRYGPIGIMWFDGGGSFRGQSMAELIDAQGIIEMIRQLQPMCLVNNRLGLPADYGTPEQHIPGQASEHLFEVCMTLNRHWGYNKYDTDWKSPKVLIRNLADIASKGGNYLLNVGPTAEGLIPQGSVESLRGVGRWMAKYGESIYGTTASPFGKLPWGRCTVKPGKLYLHVFDWPAGGVLKLERLRNPVRRAYLLGDKTGRGLAVRRVGEDLVHIAVGKVGPDPIDSVVVLEIEGKPDVAPWTVKQQADGSLVLKAVEATVHGETARYESGGGKDNIGYWTSSNDFVSWLVDLAKPGRFAVEVEYACDRGAGGSRYVVRLGDAEVRGQVRQTGSWVKFVRERIGELKISEPGRYQLVVKPESMPSYAVMNLRAVRLRPLR